MKKTLISFAALVCCAALFTSCKEDEKATSDGKAELLSFGFYSADNSGVLSEDYVAEVSEDIVIRLPESADKKALVAKFTLGEGDALILDGKTIKSGVTTVDYSYPADFIVKDTIDNVSTSFTVTVGKILQFKWAQVAQYNDEQPAGTKLMIDDFDMTLSQKDNKPYFIVSSEETSPDLEQARVGYLDEGGLVMGSYMSTDAEGTAIAASYPKVAVDADGKVYGYYYNTTAKKNYVKTGSGSSWSFVGAPFGEAKVSSVDFNLDPISKKPLVAYMSNSTITGVITKRDMDLCYYDGSAWSSENLLPEGLSGFKNYWPTIKVVNGSLYLVGTNQTEPGAYFVLKYNGAQGWTKVINALPAGVTQSTIFGMSFDVASDGTVYIFAGGDEDEAGNWKMSVYKTSSDFKSWERVSTAVCAGNKYFTMALCKDSPVVIYKDSETSLGMVVTLNAETLAWNEPVAISQTPVSTKGMCLEFTKDGIGYFSTVSSGDINSLLVFKYSLEADDLK